jgi:prephenate dehydrogenase
VERVAIFGPGLIGGSLAMALRSRCPEIHITAWSRRAAPLEELRALRLADTIQTDPAEAVREVDLVILCTPVGVMPELAALLAPHLPPQALVTDAGSVKACVTEKLEPLFGGRFLGGHPMAGSECSGLAAARADLFSGAPCILTPVETTASGTLESITRFWTTLGARVTTMSPVAHDRLVARLSHLPHAVAFALVNLVHDSLPPGASLLAGGSFRDATRVAASSPDLWTGILLENRGEVVTALREMSGLLDSLAQHLEEGNSVSILNFLTRAKERRSSLPLPPPEDPLGTLMKSPN